MPDSPPAPSSIHVPRVTTWLAQLIAKYPRMWIGLGNLESLILKPDLMNYPVRAPIYVNGLARSGTTILLEYLAAHGETASHRYQDFPFIFTPYWWQLVLKLSPFKRISTQERAHGDGIHINTQSAEAMEEIIWRAFFAQTHDITRSHVLDADVARDDFAAFYRAHIQKTLLGQKAKRYVSKANYNVTRMGYIQSLFGDARFIIPIRHPVAHIASLMRQHARFCAAAQGNPTVAAHMAAAGHFEFGPHRMPIHCGDNVRMQAITDAWKAGDDITGWALYWDMLYRFIDTQLEADDRLRAACYIARYEDLCDDPMTQLSAILKHCQLADDRHLLVGYASRIAAPTYYAPAFSAAQLAQIYALTHETAALFGYGGWHG